MTILDNHWLKRLKYRCYKKYYLLAATLCALLLFGDTILLFLWHCLQILFEFIATVVEHWLQTSFNLTERQAQLIFFYLFASFVVLVGWQLSKKIYKLLQRLYFKAHSQVCFWLTKLSWLNLTFYSAVFGSLVFMLT